MGWICKLLVASADSETVILAGSFPASSSSLAGGGDCVDGTGPCTEVRVSRLPPNKAFAAGARYI